MSGQLRAQASQAAELQGDHDVLVQKIETLRQEIGCFKREVASKDEQIRGLREAAGAREKETADAMAAQEQAHADAMVVQENKAAAAMAAQEQASADALAAKETTIKQLHTTGEGAAAAAAAMVAQLEGELTTARGRLSLIHI